METTDRPAETRVQEAPHGPIVAHSEADTGHDTEHIHLPPPTIWPVTTAFGAALGGFGIIISLPFCFAGVVIMLWGISQWVQELRHEPH